MVRLSVECNGFFVIGHRPDSLMARSRLEPQNKGETVRQFTIGYGINAAGYVSFHIHPVDVNA
jgi:hypothetical protein